MQTCPGLKTFPTQAAQAEISLFMYFSHFFPSQINTALYYYKTHLRCFSPLIAKVTGSQHISKLTCAPDYSTDFHNPLATCAGAEERRRIRKHKNVPSASVFSSQSLILISAGFQHAGAPGGLRAEHSRARKSRRVKLWRQLRTSQQGVTGGTISRTKLFIILLFCFLPLFLTQPLLSSPSFLFNFSSPAPLHPRCLPPVSPTPPPPALTNHQEKKPGGESRKQTEESQ